MADDEWLVTVGEGIMEPLSVAYMFKQLSLRDWVSYSEKFGTPGLLGKTNSAKDSPEWEALETAISEFSTDWAAVTSEGTSIELIEAKGGAGNLPFPPLVDRMDRAISTICRGADLSTMSASQGPGQGASVQGDEGDLLEQDDAAMITETLQQISRIVIRERFGDEQPLAYVQVVVPKKKDNADTRANVTCPCECWRAGRAGMGAVRAGRSPAGQRRRTAHRSSGSTPVRWTTSWPSCPGKRGHELDGQRNLLPGPILRTCIAG